MKAINLVMVVAAMGGCAVDEAGDDVAAETTSVEQANTQTSVWTGTWNGGSASAQFFGATGGGYVDVFENKSRDMRYAYMHLSAWSYDPNSLQCFDWTDWWGQTWQWCMYTRSTYSYGWGSVPESDVQLTPAHARVNTTLGTDFGGFQCTYDYVDWASSGCTSLAGGSIDLRWSKDGLVSSFTSGTSQQQFGAYTFRTQGTFRSASATPSGTVLGTPVEGGYGHFGDTRGVSITKMVFRAP